MYILGLNIFSHDTSAAIFYKKKIIAAIEEERLVKEKHTKQFPIKSIQACLKEAKIKKNQISAICIGWNLPLILKKGTILKIKKLSKILKDRKDEYLRLKEC